MPTVEIEVSPEFIIDMRRNIVKKRSAAEVVMVAPRTGGTVLLHTKAFYPPDTFRLPTGRLHFEENPDESFFREYREELGHDAELDRKLGVVVQRLISGDESLDFTSHVYLAKRSDAPPVPEDTSEQITEFIEVSVAGIRDTAEKLRNMPEGWSDWGKMRAAVHDFVAEELT